ncbi:GatB/YqeY domain-containing protein, partial [Actinoalloteichus spitiensis]|uniref:GatB/YqeY domain-containing protein n=1 Tax=Actinoalloteichus spitiensis TaxID=252394 RepID=UPI000380FB51
MSDLEERLRADLVAGMKSRDSRVVGTLRTVLGALGNAEGRTGRALTEEEVTQTVAKEARKRDEAAEAFAAAGRTDSAERERAEAEILRAYLPRQLAEDELAALVEAAIEEVGARLGDRPGMAHLGQVMKEATARVAGRADGSRVVALARA